MTLMLPNLGFQNIEPLEGSTGVRDFFKNMLETSKSKSEAKIKGEEARISPELFKAKLGEVNAHTKYLENGGGRSSNNVWMRLPQDTRASMIAQGNAWDLSPEVVAAHIAQGGTMDELKEQAKKNGIDVDSAPKIYDPTGKNRSDINNLKGSSAELDYLENVTKKGISRYGATFRGYSPAQIKEAMSGKNIDQQVEFYAARALQPEIAGVRSRIAGGSNSQEALREAQDAALGRFKIFESLLTPEIREKVQEKINEWLREGGKVRTRAMSGQYSENTKRFKEEVEKGPDYSSLSVEELEKLSGGK
jgi:hypothetical protein